MPGWACRRHAATDYGRGFALEMRYPLASFFLRVDVARRSKAAHIARSSPHQVVGIHHAKRFDVDEILYQHCVKKLLVGYLRGVFLNSFSAKGRKFGVECGRFRQGQALKGGYAILDGTSCATML